MAAWGRDIALLPAVGRCEFVTMLEKVEADRSWPWQVLTNLMMLHQKPPPAQDTPCHYFASDGDQSVGQYAG